MKNNRIKLLMKISQEAEEASTTTSTAPATIAGSPTNASVDIFPTFDMAWGSNFKEPINDLLDALNWAIFVLTVGEYDFYKLKSNNFSSGSTKFDAFTNEVIKFSGLVYKELFNSGVNFKNKVENKKDILDKLHSSVSGNARIPDTLNNTFPQSFLQTKIGNFKPKVISILSSLIAMT